MNLSIRKYLIHDRQFRVFAIEKNQFDQSGLEKDVICLSALSTMLLSQEERITFNFKDKNSRSFLYIDSFSNGECLYRLEMNEAPGFEPNLFVTKSKLKNFGASYNSIMQFKDFNLSDNLSTYYNESEQIALSFIENDNFLLVVQPLPGFEKFKYEEIVEVLHDRKENKLTDESLIETKQIKVVSSKRVN